MYKKLEKNTDWGIKMNDFTREELNIILSMCSNDCNYIIRDVSKLSQSEGTELVRQFYVGILKTLHGIRLKTQAMIDNYCEHDHLKDVGKEYKVCRQCAKEVYDNQ